GVRGNQIRASVVGIIQWSSAGPVKSLEPCSRSIRNHVRFGRRAHLAWVVVAKGDALRPRLSGYVNARRIAFDVGPVELAIFHTVDVGCETDTGMMHGSSDPGTYFDAGDPGVFLERVRQDQDDVLDPAFRRHRKRWSFDHHVRLRAPAVDPLHGRWSIFGVAFNRPVVRPFGNRVDFSLRQRVLVGEMSVLWIETS